MKRPLFVAAAVMTVISVVVCFVGEEYLPILCITALFLLVASIISKYVFKKAATGIVSVCVLFFVLSVLQYFNYNFYVKRIENLSGETQIVARVIEEPEVYKDKNILYVKTSKTESNACPNVIYLKLFAPSEYDIKPDDQIVAKVSFNKLDGHYKHYNYPSKVYTDCYTAEIVQIEAKQPHTLRYYMILLRNYIKQVLFENFGAEETAFLQGLILGDSSSMSEKEIAKFTRCGVIHIMSVSGMHISIISQFILTLLKLFGISKRRSSVIAIAFIVVLILITGAKSSVLRAGIMNIIALFGAVILRESDALNSLGFSVFAMLTVNVYYLLDISFLLSVLSFLGMIVLSKRLENIIMARINCKRILKDLISLCASSFSQSFSATLFTLPLIASYFGGVSAIASVANFLINWHITLLMALVLLAILFCSLPFISFLATPFVWLSKQVILYINAIISSLSELDIAFVSLNKTLVIAFTVICLFIVAVWMLLSQKVRFKYLFSLISGIMIAFVITNFVISYNQFKYTAINTGSGICVAVSYKGENILIARDVGEDASAIDTYKNLNCIDRFDAVYLSGNSNLQISGANILSYGKKCGTLINDDIKNKYSIYLFADDSGFVSEIVCNERLFVATTKSDYNSEFATVTVTTSTQKVGNSENTVYCDFLNDGNYSKNEFCMQSTDMISFCTSN